MLATTALALAEYPGPTPLPVNPPTARGVGAEKAWAALEKILTSETFGRSERLSRFLRFIVEQTIHGRSKELKEYVIAVDVYGRPPSYDPAVDSIVRVEARRLRSALEKYYETEGRQDTIQVELPKGRYVPVFHARGQASTAPSSTRSPAGREALAVLPFENLSAEPEQEYFCDGITEELINALAHVEGLRVVSRTSAFAFKARYQDVRSIGEALNVGTVVEGTVRKAGDRLRITAQLINVADGYHLWSERFDREMKDVFAIQDEIARCVVDALRIRLDGRQKKTLIRSGGAFWERFPHALFLRCEE